MKKLSVGLFNSRGEELSYPKYKRQLIAFNVFDPESDIIAENKKKVSFPTCPRNCEDVIAEVKIFDDRDKCIFEGPVSPPMKLGGGSARPQFLVGDLKIKYE